MRKRNVVLLVCSAVAITVPLTLKAVSIARFWKMTQRIQQLQAETGEALARKEGPWSPFDAAGEKSFSDLFQAWENAAAEFPRNASIYHGWGNDLMSYPNFEEAEKKFRRAVELDPSFGEAHRELARISQIDESRQAETLDHFEKAARFLPRNPEIYLEWGTYLESKGNPADAIDKFKRHLEIQPEDPVAYGFWAKTARDPELHIKTLKLYEQLIAAPDSPAPKDQYRGGWSAQLAQMVEDGMIDPAWSRFKTACLTHPELSTATWEYLALRTSPKWGYAAGSAELANVSYFIGLMGEDDPDVGRRKKARDSFAAYLRIKPHAANASDVRARIRALDEKIGHEPGRDRGAVKPDVYRDNILDDMFGK